MPCARCPASARNCWSATGNWNLKCSIYKISWTLSWRTRCYLSRLKIGLDHVFTNVAEYGNTSSASVPLALVEAMAQGRIKAGDRVLVTAFGSGLTWGAALLQF